MGSTALPSLQKHVPFTTFANMEGGFCNQEIVVRLIHSWKASNFMRNNLLMGIDLLLLDSQSNAVQGFIPASGMNIYVESLKANTLYKLNRFLVKPSKTVYTVADHPYNILFTPQTSFLEVAEGSHQIAKQKFRIRSFPDFSAIVDTNTELFDAIGQLRMVSGDNLRSPTFELQPLQIEGTPRKDRVFLHLYMKDGETLRVYLWGDVAEAFRARWNTSVPQPNVLLITAVNPKTIGDALSLTATSATRLFFDTDIAETKESMKWFGDGGLVIPLITTASSAITRLETVSIEEIHHFIKNAAPQSAGFFVFATVMDVLGEHGWNYISCTSCTTKLGTTRTSMYCTSCKTTNNVGVLRYRLEISVADETGDVATFVVLDRDATSVIGRRADARQPESVSVDAPDLIPKFIKTIIGKTFKFQIKVTTSNFTPVGQLLMVSRIMEDTVEEGVEVKTANVNINPNNASTRTKSTGEKDDSSGQDTKRIRLH